jgi:hypothetical protein
VVYQTYRRVHKKVATYNIDWNPCLVEDKGLICRKEALIQGEEDFASFYSSAAVAVRSCIFNTVGTARRIDIVVVLVEAHLFGDFVIIAIPLLQTPEFGNARH